MELKIETIAETCVQNRCSNSYRVRSDIFIPA